VLRAGRRDRRSDLVVHVGACRSAGCGGQQLDVCRFSNRETFVEDEIELLKAWATQSIALQVAESSRDRAAEFGARSGPPAAELLAELERTLGDVDCVLVALTPENLLELRSIQGRELSVLEAIYHVVEHFSLHLGQIILLAKLHTPGAIEFYEDAGGLARPVWMDLIRR